MSENVTNETLKTSFDWNAFMQFLLETPGKREAIGPAWFLFFDIATHADQAGIYGTTYAKLAKRYGVAVITVKTWRQYLRRHSVIESYSQGHSVAFRLLEPYLSFVKRKDTDKTGQSDVQTMNALLAIKKLLLNAGTSKTLEGVV